MKWILFVALSSVMMYSCVFLNPGEEEINCPYEPYWGPVHFLHVPVTVTPNKRWYNVGDTIIFSSNFSDSLYDSNMEHTFKIEGFPFRPYSYLYRIQDDNVMSLGYGANEVHVPEENNPVFRPAGIYTDAIYAEMVHRDDAYHFQIELVLETPGRYIFLQRDSYNDIRLTEREGNEEANAVQFEGKCANSFLLRIEQTGEDNMEYFYDELYILDEKVYRGMYMSDVSEYADGPFVRRYDFEAAFCFGVLE